MRRLMLLSLSLTLGLLACGESSSTRTPDPDTHHAELPDGADTTDPVEPTGRSWWELGMSDPFLDELVLYYLGNAAHGGTEVAEVLQTAARITDVPMGGRPKLRMETPMGTSAVSLGPAPASA